MTSGRVTCWIVSCVGGLFSIPIILWAGIFLFEWIRSLIPGFYYTPYPYWLLSLILLGAASGAVTATNRIARRRDYVYVLVPIILCLVTALELPNFLPPGGYVRDIRHLQSARRDCDRWWSLHKQYPATVHEVEQAINAAHALSPYVLRGKSVPYELVVEANATGPRLTSVQARPGILYYSVSSDHSEYWITMTAPPSSMRRDAALLQDMRGSVWVVHGNQGRSPELWEQVSEDSTRSVFRKQQERQL